MSDFKDFVAAAPGDFIWVLQRGDDGVQAIKTPVKAWQIRGEELLPWTPFGLLPDYAVPAFDDQVMLCYRGEFRVLDSLDDAKSMVK